MDRTRRRTHRADRAGRHGRGSRTDHRTATRDDGGPRRSAADLHQPGRATGDGPQHRGNRGTGGCGRLPAAELLLECRRITRRHNLFHPVHCEVHLRPLQGRDHRGTGRRRVVQARSRRHRLHSARPPVLRQRSHRDHGWHGPGVRRDSGPTAVEVLADRTEGRDGDAVGRAPVRHAGQHFDRIDGVDLGGDG